MRRLPNAILFTVLTLGLFGLVSGCPSNDPAGVYADIQYAVRCEMMGMCPGTVQRDINGFNGEGALRVTCRVTDSGDQRILNFSAASGSSYGITITNASFPRAGGSPGAGCSVTVTDGPNTFTGTCGGAAPSAAQPCQISSVAFTTEVETGSPLITGQMLCEGLPNRADATRVREVTGPAAAGGPLTFNIYDCTGYMPD